MIIGKYNGAHPGKSFALSTNWANLKECLYDYSFERRHIILVCRECGQMLAPTVQQMGPKNCGWQKTKSGWICHQCYYGWEGFDRPKEIVVKERNQKVLNEVHRYKFTHPWIKFRSM